MLRGAWAVAVEGEWERMKTWTASTVEDGTVTVDLYAGAYEARASKRPALRTSTIQIGAQPAVVELGCRARVLGAQRATRQRRASPHRREGL